MRDDGLEVLAREECLELLAGASVGRVVYTDGGLPAVLPVTYALDGGAVLFSTRAGSRLASATDGTVVAFEVDDVEPALQVGWSVSVLGRASSGPRTDGTPGPVPRAPEVREHEVRIPLTLVTGRRIPLRPGGTRVVAAGTGGEDDPDARS